MRVSLIAGNWKMYTTPEEGAVLAAGVVASANAHPDREVLLFPPFLSVLPALEAVKGSPVGVGIQNCSQEREGAFTGEVSPWMAKAAGCSHVLVGHSERRSIFGESDAQVRAKLNAVIAAGLSAVICLGESLAEREAGQTLGVVERQAKLALEGIEPPIFSRIVIAYEPVWAIGTGKVATPEQADEVHGFLRSLLTKHLGAAVGDAQRILYGGSVKPENIDELMACPNIDGVLVGGASLKAESFSRIIAYQSR